MEQSDRDLAAAFERATGGAFELRKSGRIRVLYKRTAEGQYANTGTAFTSQVAAYAWLLYYVELERNELRVKLDATADPSPRQGEGLSPHTRTVRPRLQRRS